jgi:hypothetical protein
VAAALLREQMAFLRQIDSQAASRMKGALTGTDPGTRTRGQDAPDRCSAQSSFAPKRGERVNGQFRQHIASAR